MSRKSVGYFLDRVVINSYPEPRAFGEIAEDWQKEILRPKVAALEGMTGLRTYHGPRSFLTVLPRGHDKSSLEGRLMSWALCYSPRKIEGYLCAADRDQAALVMRAMKDEADLNPWYRDKLDFQRNKVVGPCGQVEVVPADAASAYGFRGNLYIMDEVTHWKNDHLWSAVVSGREKIPGSLLICISNAGLKGSWQEELLYNNAKRDPDEWILFERKGHLASWMTPDRIAKVRAAIPELIARRVLDNQWIDPAEETGYLSHSDVQACLCDAVTTVPSGAQCVAAVDYGATNDRTALTLVYMDADGIVRIPVLDTIQGTKDSPVSVEAVEKWIQEVHVKYKPKVIFVDPHQMEGTIQRLRNLPIERVQFRGGAFNCDIATNLRTLIVNRRIKWHPKIGMDFAGELMSLVTKITPHGYRFDHTSGRHDDQAFAVAVAAIDAVKRPFIKPVLTASVLESRQTDGMGLFGGVAQPRMR